MLARLMAFTTVLATEAPAAWTYRYELSLGLETGYQGQTGDVFAPTPGGPSAYWASLDSRRWRVGSVATGTLYFHSIADDDGPPTLQPFLARANRVSATVMANVAIALSDWRDTGGSGLGFYVAASGYPTRWLYLAADVGVEPSDYHLDSFRSVGLPLSATAGVRIGDTQLEATYSTRPWWATAPASFNAPSPGFFGAGMHSVIARRWDLRASGAVTDGGVDLSLAAEWYPVRDTGPFATIEYASAWHDASHANTVLARAGAVHWFTRRWGLRLDARYHWTNGHAEGPGGFLEDYTVHIITFGGELTALF